jgi:hypothetical protein
MTRRATAELWRGRREWVEAYDVFGGADVAAGEPDRGTGDNAVQRPYNRFPMGNQRLERDRTAATAVGDAVHDAASGRAQEDRAGQQRIALTQDEAAHFLDALETAHEETVACLRELRERA